LRRCRSRFASLHGIPACHTCCQMAGRLKITTTHGSGSWVILEATGAVRALFMLRALADPVLNTGGTLQMAILRFRLKTLLCLRALRTPISPPWKCMAPILHPRNQIGEKRYERNCEGARTIPLPASSSWEGSIVLL
jgi:hypothetical protein